MRERKGERSYCTQYGTSSTGRGAPGKTGLHVRTYVYVYTASYIERRGRGEGLLFLLLCTKRAFQGEKRRSLGFPPFPPPRLPPPSTLGGATVLCKASFSFPLACRGGDGGVVGSLSLSLSAALPLLCCLLTLIFTTASRQERRREELFPRPEKKATPAAASTLAAFPPLRFGDKGEVY